MPETTANLWVNYAPIRKLQMGTGVRFVDDRYTSDANTAMLPAYTVLDASLSWLLDDDTTLTLRARNLTDEQDYVQSEYVTDQWVYAEPRAYEMSVRYSF